MALEEADLDMTNFAMALDQNPRQNEGDDQLYVRFLEKPREDEAKSAELGRPIFKTVTYIQIMQPGNKENIILRPVTKRDMARFKKAYDHYQANKDEDYVEGTPLSTWPALNAGQVEELKHFNIRTVEQLANISDVNAQNFMGAQQLKQRAQAFLEVSEKSAEGEILHQKLEASSNEVAMLHAANEDLQKKNAVLEAKLQELEARIDSKE